VDQTRISRYKLFNGNLVIIMISRQSKMGVAKVIRLFINISANIYRRIIYFISFKEHTKYSLEKKSFPSWKLLVIFKQFKQIKLHKKRKQM